MKTARFALLCALAASLPLTVHALHWNQGVSAGRRDGTWQGGSISNWNDDQGGSQTWPSFSLFGSFTPATFNSPEDGTVTVSGTVWTSGIEAGDGGAYTITGGTISKLFGNLTIDVGDLGNESLRIDSALSNSTVVKRESGTLDFRGTTSGNLRIEGGLVILSENNIADGSDLDVRSGAAVRLNGDDTVDELVLEGTTQGSGVLTASTYTLRDGATINGYLGEGNFSKADAGTVTLNGGAASDVIAVPEGTLILSGNNLEDSALVSTSNIGILEVNGDDTVGTYTQSGNGSLTGIGTLTTTGGATLNSGEVAGNLAGNISSQGSVLISGTTRGGTLAVDNGTLTLTGRSSNPNVNIASPATLINQGDLGDSTNLTNQGTFRVAGTDTIGSYSQTTGSLLTGGGTLTTTGGAILNGGEVAGKLAGDVSSRGDVLISGTTSGGTLTVDSGTLTLTGRSTNPNVQIANGGTLINRGDLGNSANVVNQGTLLAPGTDSIGSYSQTAGSLFSGLGTLTATDSITLTGGEVAGNLLGDTTSNGDVLISGTTGGGNLLVSSGTLTLTGTSTHDPVTIDSGATLLDQGSLSDTAAVTNAGTLTVDVVETVGTYTQNNGGLLNGTDSLTTTGGATLNGGEVAGTLLGDTTSTGNVLVSGTIGGGSLVIDSGILTLTGTSTNTPITIASAAAALDDQSGGLADTAEITNQGALNLDVNETVATYVSHGGRLSGNGTLTVTGGATLEGGSTIAGHLAADTTSNGSVLVSGTIGGGHLAINSGTLTLSGASTNATVQIEQFARLDDQAGGLDPAAIVTNAGNLELGTNDSIDRYVSHGGILSGAGTLTATGGAALNDGSRIKGNLFGDTTSNGDVNILGSVGGSTLSIQSGTLTLFGTATSTGINIDPGTTLDALPGAALDPATAVTNLGMVNLSANLISAGTYTSNGGTLTGPGLLDATGGAALNDGSIVSGNLVGDTTSNGAVLVSGTIGGGSLAVDSGTLTLTGSSTNNPVTILGGATLIDEGNLDDAADVTNAGTLTVNVIDRISTYTSNGGTLDGTGWLDTLSGATLNDGSTVSGTLLGDTTSNGAVLISGAIGGGSLSVGSGVLTLTGTSTNAPVTILGGAALVDDGDLADAADVTNAGTLTVNVADTIGTYLSDSGLLDGSSTLMTAGTSILNGSSTIAGKLMAMGGATLNGLSTVTGLLTGDTTFNDSSSVGASGVVDGNLTSTGPAVLIEGMVGGGALDVTNGTLTLTGNSTHDPVTIASGATLIDNGDLADTAAVTNAGTLQVDTDDTVGTYVSNSATLSGSGLLIAKGGATLNDGSIVSGSLTGDIETSGAVLVSGEIGIFYIQWPLVPDLPEGPVDYLTILPPPPSGGSLDVTSGTLTITGSVLSDPITIRSGATVIDQSSDAFSDWADLTNHGLLVLNGSETIGSYESAPGGALQVDVSSPSVLDRLVANAVTLATGSKLILETTDLMLGEVADIIDGAISGTFDEIKALAGAGRDLRYTFNPNDGSIQALPGRSYPMPTPRNTLHNLSWNQTQVVGTVFDDTHVDPLQPPGAYRIGNFRRIYYRDTGNPDPALRWKEIPPSAVRLGDTWLYDLDPGLGRAPVTPGTQAALLGDALAAFQSSYDILRDRSGAPVLDPAGNQIPTVTGPGMAVANSLSPEVHQGMADFTRQALRSQVRAAMDTVPSATAGSGNVFAAFHTAQAGSTKTTDGADYNIDVNGAVAGVRYQVLPSLQLGAMLGTVDGKIEGPLVDTDADGFMIGVFGEYLVDPRSQATVFSSLSYGNYDYDATRRSFGGAASVSNIDSSAWEFALGIEAIALQTDQFRLIPSGTFRYLNGDVEGFVETGPGVQMAIGDIDSDSFLLEFGLDAELDLSERAILSAHLGYLVDLKGSGNPISGSYIGGGLPVTVTAPGVDGEAVVFGMGTSFDVSETVRLGMNWRSEFREKSQDTHLLSIGGRMSF